MSAIIRSFSEGSLIAASALLSTRLLPSGSISAPLRSRKVTNSAAALRLLPSERGGFLFGGRIGFVVSEPLIDRPDDSP